MNCPSAGQGATAYVVANPKPMEIPCKAVEQIKAGQYVLLWMDKHAEQSAFGE